MQGRNLEEDLHASIVGSLATSKRIVDTLERTKAWMMRSNLERFPMIKTSQPLQLVRKRCYLSVNKLELILQMMSAHG